MKCFVCICYSARCSLVSKLLTVSHARSMKMNDDILVVVVALLDCTMKLRAAIEKSTAIFDKERAQEWLSKISGGGVVFKVRKASKAEVGARKDRVTDALNVTRAAAEEGMVPDEEDNLLQGINSYRQSLNMPALSKNDKAGYLADEIADQLEHQPCMTTTSPITTASSSRPQITNFLDLLEKCNIDIFPSSFQLWSSQTTRNPSFQGMSITPSTPELA